MDGRLDEQQLCLTTFHHTAAFARDPIFKRHRMNEEGTSLKRRGPASQRPIRMNWIQPGVAIQSSPPVLETTLAHSKPSLMASAPAIDERDDVHDENTIVVRTSPDAGSQPRTPVLPPLSSSTEEVLARIWARSQDEVAHTSGPPKGWFLLDFPSAFAKPRPIRDIVPGPSPSESTESQAPSFSKADLMSTLSTSLAPKSRVLPSQRIDETDVSSPTSDSLPTSSSAVSSNVDDFATKAAAAMHNALNNVAYEPPASQSLNPSPAYAYYTTPSSHPSTPPPQLLAPAVPMNPPRGRPPSVATTSRKPHTYVLPDGTVLKSGKGLGRGRPGIKRGPRKSKLSTEVMVDHSEDTKPAPPSVPSTPTTGKKRKRADSSASEVVDEPTSRSTTSTPEYTPQSTQTRSGRQTQKPPTFVPPASPLDATAPPTAIPSPTAVAKKPSLTFHPSQPQKIPISHPKIKRRQYRGREQLALCEHCLRGYGPAGNAIVFCDLCNRVWHQRCHEPMISNEVVSDAKAEWICGSCDSILHQTKKAGKKGKGSRTSTSAPTASLQATDRGTLASESLPLGLVPASRLTREQRLAFLSSLTKDKLIDLVLRASDLAPTLPLFEDPNPQPPPQPVLYRPAASNSGSNHAQDDDEGFEDGEDEDEYLYFDDDENARLYPKAGHGIRLPPDSVDLHMYLEGPECKTFSHWVRPVEAVNPIRAAA